MRVLATLARGLVGLPLLLLLLAWLPFALLTSGIGYGLMWLSRRPAKPGSLFRTFQQALTQGRHEAALRDFGYLPEQYR